MTTRLHEHMSCHDAILAMWDYLDDEIDRDRKERIREHLGECDHCRDQYTFEGTFLCAVSDLLDGDADTESLRMRIETALTAHGFPKPA